jgi:hypothetical protein
LQDKDLHVSLSTYAIISILHRPAITSNSASSKAIVMSLRSPQPLAADEYRSPPWRCFFADIVLAFTILKVTTAVHRAALRLLLGD